MSPTVIVKHNLIIFRNYDEWHNIYAKILEEFGLGMAVRTRLRRELGFTYRHHRGLVSHKKIDQQDPGMHYENQVHVDFYSESAQSWFILRYLNTAGTDPTL